MHWFNSKGDLTMKNKKVAKGSLKTAVAAMSLLGLLAIAAPQDAAALTSGNATIHNAVTVVYTAGSVTKYVTNAVNITVTTLASPPTVTNPTGLNVYSGGAVNYTVANLSAYTVRSTSNGPDTYTVSSLVENVISSSVSAAAAVSNTPSVDLWGGYIVGVGAGGSNIVKIPAGSEAGLTAGTSTIEFIIGATMRKYTVTTITAGVAASTVVGTADASPTTSGETYTQLTLTPLGHAVAAETAAVGTQAGEYKSLEVVFTAGVPSTVGTNGLYNTTFTLSSASKLADGTTSATTSVTGVSTVVYSPAVTIVKKSRNFTTAPLGPFATNTTARPGEVLEYEITVSNTHTAATVSNVSISDVVPSYTTALAGTYSGNDVQFVTTVSGTPTTTTGTFTGADTDQVYLNAGTLILTFGAGAGDAHSPATNGGAIAQQDNVVINYKVTVQ